MTSGELVATTTMPALFDPGEGWMYGISIDIVGRMVEEVSGRRLDDYFDEHILGPLGMGSTSFGLSDDLQSRSAAMHARSPTARWPPSSSPGPPNRSTRRAAAGSTARSRTTAASCR